MTWARSLGCLLGIVPVLSMAQTQTATVYDASRYVLIDPRMLRGSVGYTTFGIGDVDTLADRLGQGVDMRIEGRIISGFVDKTEGFVVADGLFLDLTMGRLSSEPLSYYKDPESTFSTVMKFGYSFLAGYSNDHFGALGGIGFEWSSAFVGGTDVPGEKLLSGTVPWMMRLEFRPAFSQEFRIMVTGWDNFNATRLDQGFRVDIPFLPNKRFFLTYSFSRMKSDVSYATFDNDRYAPGTLTQQMVGLRFGSIY